ncbi:MAG: hypothetical protein HYU78_06435 [Rhodocyclales bacterium]|nr:hypothetical protein [Rhodocyclales bacterium]
MTHVVFYGKPGCSGNARQMDALVAAGHTVEVRDLLRERWTAGKLLAFLAPLPVAEWFNRSAPAVKAGAVVPENLGVEAALRLLIEQPLLIRRPLLKVGRARRVGFDAAAIDAWIGLADAPPDGLDGCIHNDASPGHCAAAAA